MKRLSVIISVIVIVSFCPVSWAYKAYVTDSFRISLRRGPSIENKILKFISSGQPVEVEETDNGWSKIEIMDDEKNTLLSGWVLNRYLITRAPWEEQVKQLKEQNNRLMNGLADLEKKLQETSSVRGLLSEELRKNSASMEVLRNKYESLVKDASNYLKLKKEHEAAKKLVNRLSSENKAMRSSHSRRWFAVGALVLLCGLLIGILMGKREKRHRSYY